MAPSKKKTFYRRKAELARMEYLRAMQAQKCHSSGVSEESAMDNQPMEEADNPVINQSGVGIQVAEGPPVASGNSIDPPMSSPAHAPEVPNDQSGSTPGEIELDTSAYNRPPTIEEAQIALDSVSDAIRTRRPTGGYIYHDLDPTTRDRFTAMRACLNNFLRASGKSFIEESLNAAGGLGKGATYARAIRAWIRDLIKTGDLPYFKHGWWNVPLLGDEDIGREIKAHLQSVGKYACAEDIVKFLSDPETRTRLGVPKPIGLRTAQRWMSKYGGFRWRAELKGQYFDGHERADVVGYRQSVYIPFMQAIERLTVIYNEDGIPDPQRPILIGEGEKPVVVWFHDESIFFANDRRIVRWIGADEHATPFKKGEGNTIMVADFVCPQFGWLKGKNGSVVLSVLDYSIRRELTHIIRESARVVFRPGVNRDGWFTCNKVVSQLEKAVKIVQETYPEYTHVFVYDNAPSHTKRPEDAISARSMPKGEVAVFPRPYTVKGPNGTTQKVTPPRMELGQLPDGTAQSFYWPDDHERVNQRGWFKGMAQILRERGLHEVAAKKAECLGFKCEPGRTDCCCRRALFSQPDFESRDSNLEEAARKLGTRVIFLPKYHCELNPIEQCWGYAKRKYRQMPPTNKESVMIKYVIDAIDSVPIQSIRKFAARSQRFVDAYASGRNGELAIKWATKQFRSHRTTPTHIPIEDIAPGDVHMQNNTFNG